MSLPKNPKIYHIVHVDRLPSIIADGHLLCDAEVEQRNLVGTTIGMTSIKLRRSRNKLKSRPDLRVGDCVPFYFCPRSIMLYLIYKKHWDLTYQDGQEPIVHLEADLYDTIAWADKNNRKWAFTLSNAGSWDFEDFCDLTQLGRIDWNAVRARYWRECKEGKQAEFLVEGLFPWSLVRQIGVISRKFQRQVIEMLQVASYKPSVEIKTSWYY